LGSGRVAGHRRQGVVRPGSRAPCPGRRPSATPCWTPPSRWRPGCSTTTPTPSTRSPSVRRRAAVGQPHLRPHPRQHHDLLADRHADLVRAVVLVERTGTGPHGRSDSARGEGPGRVHHVPRRDQANARSWVEKAYRTLSYFHEADRGGHFAAWEDRSCSHRPWRLYGTGRFRALPAIRSQTSYRRRGSSVSYLDPPNSTASSAADEPVPPAGAAADGRAGTPTRAKDGRAGGAPTGRDGRLR
jgi:hypothetical protein